MRFQIPTQWKEWLPATKSKEEKPQSSCALGEAPSSTSKEGEPPKSRGKSPWAPSPKSSTDSSSRKSSSYSKHSLTSKEHHDMREKDSHSSSSKHQDKPHSDRVSKDKESSKTSWKCVVSPPQRPSSTEWAEKEPCLGEPSLTFNASSQSQHSSPSRYLSERQPFFPGPQQHLYSNKTEGGPCIRSVSSNSRCSMTHFEMGLGRSFSIPSYAGVHHGSITPATSVARSQQVTSSGWHHSASFSPLTPQDTDTLSTEKATEVYQLAAECWALGSKLAKQFQTLSRLEAMHHTMAQAMAHETAIKMCSS